MNLLDACKVCIEKALLHKLVFSEAFESSFHIYGFSGTV
jgi:hypothetical protein